MRLCIVGSGPLKEELERLVKVAGVESRVIFVERATEEELSNLIINARVVVAPSEREGFGLVVAEALSVGTPVVTVDASTNASKELVIDGITGRICKSGDLLAETPDRAAAIEGWNSLGIPKNYEDVAREYWPMFQRLVRRPRRARLSLFR